MTAVKKDDVQMSDATKKWMVLAPELAKRGVDTSKLKGLNIAVVVGQFEVDFDNVDAAGSTDDAVQEWVDGLLEEHPSWETPAHKRLRHVKELLDEYESGYGFEEYIEIDEPTELAKHKYVMVYFHDGHVADVHGADSEIEVAKRELDNWFAGMEAEYGADYLESIYDLDTGDVANLDYKTTIVTTCNSHEVARMDGDGWNYYIDGELHDYTPERPS